MTSLTSLLLLLNVFSLPVQSSSHANLYTAGNHYDFTPPTKSHGFTDAANFEDSVQTLYTVMRLAEYDLPFEAFRYGMIGYFALREQGKLGTKKLLSIIDFTKPSTQKRFYTLDLDQLSVKYFTYVSHGRNTGEDTATSFSNIIHSNQSSLGFYVTAETYVGSKGYSLKLDGMERGYNDNMRTRAVVMHEADYVSEAWIKRYGRLGRSQGCPALPKEISKEVIDAIKHHTVIFAYSNDAGYLTTSSYVNLQKLFPMPDGITQPADLIIPQ